MANWVECTSPEGTKIWVNFDNATALHSYGAKGETLISFEKGNTIHIKDKVAQLAERGLRLARGFEGDALRRHDRQQH